MNHSILQDILVLDFTSNIAGPCAGALLADIGARVIHIEKPVLGDDNRNWAGQADGTCCSHFLFNRSKESLELNLRDPRGKHIALELAKKADVLIESAKPGSMAKMGLGYEDIKKVNPRIVYCSISGFGHTGPYSHRAGYDVIAQAYSGFMNYTTPVKDGMPTKVTPEVGDYVASINAYGNIMAALYDREHTGMGRHVDISLARGLLSMMGPMTHPYTGKPSRLRHGNVSATLCPYGLFQYDAQTYVAIGAANNALFRKLCVAIDRVDMAQNPNFATVPLRAKHMTEIYAAIEGWLQSFPTVDEAIAVLNAHGVANNKVMSMEDLETDPHALACGWIREIPTPDSVVSRPKQLAPVGIVDFSDYEFRLEKAPDLGQHNHKILTELGMKAEEFEPMLEQWHQEVLGVRPAK